MGETLIGVEGKEAGTGKGCKKSYGKAGQCEEDGFPVVPDGAVEAGAIEEQGFPDDDDGDEAGYFSQQYARETPQGTGDQRNKDVDDALHPCRPGVVIVATGCVEGIHGTAGKHDERIDQQQDEDGMAEQVFLS